jgi:hypothetical protein
MYLPFAPALPRDIDRCTLVEYARSGMKFAKVEFPSDDAAAKALHGIMQRGKITGLRDGTFLVPEPALEWLKEQV